MGIKIKDPEIQGRYDNHVKYYDGCSRCTLANCGTNYVFARGSLPCDILFIGEAPGRDEDKEGEPFVGRSGKLLDKILKKISISFRYAITNTVLCIPLRDVGEKHTTLRQPTREEVAACNGRLKQFIRIARPKGVVFLGNVAFESCWDLAKEFVPENKIIKVWHPSYILRNGGVGSSQFDKVKGQLEYFIKEVKK